MASTPTSNLKLEKQGVGDNLNVWGTELNAALDAIDEAIAQQVTISLTGNHTLTSTNYDSNQSRQAVLIFSDGGLSGVPTVTAPAIEKTWWVKNTGSTHAVTFGISGGTSVTIPTGGRWVKVFADGTDCEIHDPTVSDLKAPSSALAMNGQKITGLGAPTADTDASTKKYIDDLASSGNLATVAGIAADITTVAWISANVTTVAGDAADIGTVATNIADVNTVATNMADVQNASSLVSGLTAADIANVAAGSIAATDVQAAINELDTEKLALAGGTLTGPLKTLELQETVATALTGTTPTVDVEDGSYFTLTTSGNTTFTFSNPAASGTASSFVLEITAGGTHTLTWPASVDWVGGSAPDAPADTEIDLYVFVTRDGGTTWFGFLAGDALA